MRFLKKLYPSATTLLLITSISVNTFTPIALAEEEVAADGSRKRTEELMPEMTDDQKSKLKETGKARCEAQRTAGKIKSQTDPCVQAKMMEDGGFAQGISGIGYAIATTICGIECGTGGTGTACAWGSGGALATELVANFAFASEQNNVAQTLAGTAGTIAPMITSATTKEGEESKMACLGAAYNGIQTVVRGANWKMSYDKADTAYMQKMMMVGTGPTIDTSFKSDLGETNKVGGGGANIIDPATGLPIAATAAQAAGTTGPSAASAISALERNGQGPLLKKFEEMTGKSPLELADKILSGTPPLAAIAEMSGDKLGSDGMAMLGQIQKAAENLSPEQLAKLEDADRKEGTTESLYASVSGSSSKAGGADGGLQMPDFGTLMGNLLPKPGDKKAEAERKLAMIAQKPKSSSLVSPNGFHPASRSIFDVVSSKYSSVSLAWNRSPASTSSGKPMEPQTQRMPVNPYLKK